VDVHDAQRLKHNPTMALDPSSGFAAGDAAALADAALPIFDVQSVELLFTVAPDYIVAAQAANNVLIIALSNGRILRIDLNRPEDIDGSHPTFRFLPSPSLPAPRSPLRRR
jgi:hypothetical protein